MTSQASSIDAGFILNSLLVWGICTVLTGLFVGAVTWGITRQKIKTLIDEAKALRQIIERHDQAIHKVQLERADCAAVCARTFTTRAEMARLISDQTTQYQRLEDSLAELNESLDLKLAKVHSRINNVAESLASLDARALKKESAHA